MNRKVIGVVVPLDYLSIQGGATQRIKADLNALIYNGYDVEVIFPSRVSQLKHSLPSKLTSSTYPNIQSVKFLPEKIKLLFDMYTQIFNPFFGLVLKKRCGIYSVIIASFPWSAAASYRAVKKKIPLVFVAK
ncbi:hypothetical protein ACFLVS_02630 [Chloroflexota bacterium]